ncbi:MAG: hypothetical protein A2031_08155 [Deltaproteobacteria bacterium RBG_19FT_COMBO_43_11]|nr:MAG: hypothetical protein A2031_08155 [Deltaproteobacteria bacterium RBG_19FT_COMBO_43_11]
MKSKIVKRKKKEVDTIASLKKKNVALGKQNAALKRQLLKVQKENMKIKKDPTSKNKPFDNCMFKDFPDK